MSGPLHLCKDILQITLLKERDTIRATPLKMWQNVLIYLK